MRAPKARAKQLGYFAWGQHMTASFSNYRGEHSFLEDTSRLFQNRSWPKKACDWYINKSSVSNLRLRVKWPTSIFLNLSSTEITLIYQSHSFEGQERYLKSVEVCSSTSAARSNIVLGRQNNAISIIIYCYGLSLLRFKSVHDRAWPNYRSYLDLFRYFARRQIFVTI